MSYRFLVVLFLVSAPVAWAGPAECFERAMAENLFKENSYEKAMKLCAGRGSIESVRCFQRVNELGFFKVTPELKALDLCAKAQSLEPIDCYRKAYEQMSSPLERSKHALLLCGGGSYYDRQERGESGK